MKAFHNYVIFKLYISERQNRTIRQKLREGLKKNCNSAIQERTEQIASESVHINRHLYKG